MREQRTITYEFIQNLFSGYAIFRFSEVEPEFIPTILDILCHIHSCNVENVLSCVPHTLG
jgi:hypothetical protein